MAKSPPALAEKHRPDFFCLLTVRNLSPAPPAHHQHRKTQEHNAKSCRENPKSSEENPQTCKENPQSRGVES